MALEIIVKVSVFEKKDNTNNMIKLFVTEETMHQRSVNTDSCHA